MCSLRFFFAAGALVALAGCHTDATSGTGGQGGTSATGGSGSGQGGSSGHGGSSGATGQGGSTGSGGATSTGGHGGSAATDAATDGASSGMTPVQQHGQLKVVGTQLQDQSGNPVQLKGVSSQWLNLESKTFPESKPAIQYARDHWKLSVIRAAMGVDTSGGYLGTNATNANMAGMLAKVTTIVQNAIDLGIYVIVDWHTSDAVKTNGTTQATQASAFFTMMATMYGSTPNIIYEDYNEPTGVTWAQITPYHQAVVAAIRAVDPDNLIVLGTPTWSQDVDLAAAAPIAGTNLLYTLHFYACTHGQALINKANTAIAMGLPLFVTEFGATPADGGVTKSGDNYVCEPETNVWFAWMAQNNISGASWKLDQCTDSSCILTADAPVDGPWTDNYLTQDTGGTPVDGGEKGGGHGQFIVNWMRE
ncbi:MAG TPA: glycoside hydrolase family 5 protein [Polyangia bacterium]|nr:glycoside hydrolase family 5 protein [Polyangia bacterium]